MDDKQLQAIREATEYTLTVLDRIRVAGESITRDMVLQAADAECDLREAIEAVGWNQ